MKPHILFVTEKWTEGNPRKQTTNNQHNLFGSLEASELATFECVHYDEHYVLFKEKIDKHLINKVKRTKPDLVVVCPLPGYEHGPSAQTYELISKFSKIVFIWPDAVYFMNVVNELEKYSTLSILWDMDVNWEPDSKKIHLWTPQDPRIYYYEPDVKQTIDVSFLGNGDYPERKYYLERLKNYKIDVFVAGGRNKNQNYLPIEEYADVLRRSKISLNFSQSSDGKPNLKGRIFESMLCHSMVLESRYEKNWIDRWFIDGIHFVSFCNPTELKEKVLYYLNSPEERNIISANGYRRATEFYSNVAWWKTVLYESGISLA